MMHSSGTFEYKDRRFLVFKHIMSKFIFLCSGIKCICRLQEYTFLITCIYTCTNKLITENLRMKNNKEKNIPPPDAHVEII